MLSAAVVISTLRVQIFLIFFLRNGGGGRSESGPNVYESSLLFTMPLGPVKQMFEFRFQERE